MNAVTERQNPPQSAVDTPTKMVVEWGTPVAAARLRRWLEDGPRSLRMASFGANFFVVLAAATHIFTDLFTLHPLSALVNCYLVAFGAAGMTVEIEMCHATGRCKMRHASRDAITLEVVRATISASNARRRRAQIVCVRTCV